MSRGARSIADTSLRPVERRVLEAFVAELRDALGERLVAVWLFGSRARGEPGGPDSDVDLLVVSAAGKRDFTTVQDALWRAAEREGDDWLRYAAHVRDPERVTYKRAVEDFFQAEVDRDKVVLAGAA